MTNMSYKEKVANSILVLLSNKGNYTDYAVVDKSIQFENGMQSSIEFFKRFDGVVSFENKTVLDVGFGLGAACFHMALGGAKKVVGIETNQGCVSFAKTKLKDYPGLEKLLEFKLCQEMDEEKFDIVLSKDSFEHYETPENYVLTLKNYLNPNGKLVVCFSPL